ncbi:MAG: hypothetical protein HKO53_05850 [Gemmatimonadetes bacterium]|nr:hypothetical protein [Gemmatimonadota bacterium]
MKTITRTQLLVAVAVASVLTMPAGLLGQASLTISGGPAFYDLSGTGTSAVAALRLDVPARGPVSVQVGPSFFWYTSQGGQTTAMLIPEVGLEVRVPRTPAYLVAGGGHTWGMRGDSEDDVVLFAGLGVKIQDRGGWSLRPQVRVHAVDPWTGSIGEFSLGLSRSMT